MLHFCRFHAVIYDTLDKCLGGGVESDSCTYTARTLPTELTLKEPLGIVVCPSGALVRAQLPH